MNPVTVKHISHKIDFLYIGIGISLLVHGMVFQTFSHMARQPLSKHYGPSVLVPVIIPEPQPKPEEKKTEIKTEPEKKPVVKPAEIKKANPLPVSHIRKENAKPVNPETVKPVFGVTEETLTESADSGIGVRVGNTLMKEQEKEVTPKERVRSYETIPVFDLTSLPVFKKRVMPVYPEQLEKEEIEGEVLLEVTIDEKGVVVDATIKRSDHELFSKAAIDAMLSSSFEPGIQNGQPVATKIDIPVKFILED
ncbi:MAG: TonB family protein [Proteobacteria bacterium]|nr:TonB family protein [Pseudomonadota bacterium]